MSLGIKETKEAFVGVNELALFLISRLKDGIGMDDAVAAFQKLSTDEDFRNKLLEAVKGIEQVPAEIKDINMQEGMELATLALAYIPRYGEALS